MEKQNRYIFSGLMYAGKDFVAKAAGLSVIGFADPIYELVQYFAGTVDKTKPGVRRLMQQIGQWGQGIITEEYPVTAERAALTEQIRGMQARNGHSSGLALFPWVRWNEYGTRQDFWVNILLQSIKRNPLYPGREPASKNGLAVTNARFDHELIPMAAAGFQHFHVMCSEATRLRRMAEAGYMPIAKEVNDYSEALAYKLNVSMPDRQVIWNDDIERMPAYRNYVALEEFRAWVELNASGKPIGDVREVA